MSRTTSIAAHPAQAASSLDAAYFIGLLTGYLELCPPLSEDDRAHGVLRDRIACAHEQAGQLSLVIPLFEAGLADDERVLGPDHPDTFASRNNLAGGYQSTGDLARPIPLYEVALAGCERILGPDHPTTRVVRGNLASARG